MDTWGEPGCGSRKREERRENKGRIQEAESSVLLQENIKRFPFASGEEIAAFASGEETEGLRAFMGYRV